MAYKFKPNKSVAKRLRLTKTGKVKRHHGFTSHLMSSRTANKRRKLREPAIMSETHARNMRKLMGMSGIRPGRARHERELHRRQLAADAAKGQATSSNSTESQAERK